MLHTNLVIDKPLLQGRLFAAVTSLRIQFYTHDETVLQC